MLMDVLKALATGRAYNRADLAKQLGISEGLLAQMLEDLARKGYLAPLATRCEAARGGCGGCSLSKACASCPSEEPSGPKGWVLTEKGLTRARDL